MIRNYNDFISALQKAGFSGSIGGKDEGVFNLFRYGWAGRSADAELLAYATEGAEEETGIQWHTDDPDTDPWQWRIRVLSERSDIAYSKLFFRKAGYITKEWYPYFYAARRGDKIFEDEYLSGVFSNYAKRVYDAVSENNCLSLQDIKRIAGFSREDKSKVESALTELQMKMYLTICDIHYKISQKGEEYGFSTTVFSTTESFLGDDVLNIAANIKENEAVEVISERILSLNPSARKDKINKFIKG